MPVISGLQPAEGAAGQTLTLRGSGFVGANGLVVAYFGSSPTGTRCPVQDRCLVTVPPGKPGSTAVVRLHTAAGQSNGVTFTYR